MGRVRSTTEGVSTRLSAIGRCCRVIDELFPPILQSRDTTWILRSHRAIAELLGEAALETFGDLLAGQVAADENDAAFALLILFPWPLMIAIEDHVHALKDKALIVILEGEDALATQNVRALFLHRILDPRKKLIGVERLVGAKRDRLHFFVVVMLQPAVRMRVRVIVFVVVIAVLVVEMVVLIALEKGRLQIENAVEVEGAAAQNRIERNLGAFSLVQLGIRVDAANARFDVA